VVQAGDFSKHNSNTISYKNHLLDRVAQQCKTRWVFTREALLPKRRILELYANVIEMGRGIYGVEAASQHYFGVSARGLTRKQSAMLAAVLPNPKGWDPTKPGRTLRWRQRRILQREHSANFPEKLLR
jgi:monofunctional biosynthetic peptidoglycan transglycosylase